MLTNKLKTAFKRLDAQVTVDDVKQEEKLLEADTEATDFWRNVIWKAAANAGGKIDGNHWETILAALRAPAAAPANDA